MKLHVGLFMKKKSHSNVTFVTTFSQNSNMKSHVASFHEGKKPFKCDICDHSFSQKRDLNTHVASVHEEKKQFKCDICNYCCFLKQHMKQHVKKSMKLHIQSVNITKKTFQIIHLPLHKSVHLFDS